MRAVAYRVRGQVPHPTFTVMPLDRFSAQAADYARYRIDYPAELYDWLLPQVAAR